MAQYARIEVKTCPMFDDTCAATVMRHIEDLYTRTTKGELTIDVPAIIEKACGRYIRGKHTGKLRGYAYMNVVTKGGWQKLGPGEGNGRVVTPGTILEIRIVDFAGKPYFCI